MYNWWAIEDICKDVKCKASEYCVIKSKGVAVCVQKMIRDTKEDILDNNMKSKQKLFNTDDEEEDDYDDDDDDEEDVEEKSTFAKSDENKLKLCNPCPVVRPEFICGTDNSTYSSVCRLDFHNCVHKTDVKLDCTGFCPCLKKRTKPEKKSSKPKKSGKFYENKDKYLNKLRQEKKNWNNFNDKNVENFDKTKKSKFYYKTNKMKSLETKQNMQNSVLPHKQYEPSTKDNKKCSADELKSMGSRLLDWFSVVIAEQKKNHNPKKHSATKIPDCQPEVSIMFHHFDTNNDLKLSLKELYYLEHDQNEHCLQPYLNQCDEDNDDFLSAYEWCTCFDKKSIYFKNYSFD